MANIGNLRKRAKQIENPTDLPDETDIESIISNAARNSSEETVDSSITDDLTSLIEAESAPAQKPAVDEVPIPEFKMPEAELDDDDDDDDFDLPEIKAPEPVAKPAPVEPEPEPVAVEEIPQEITVKVPKNRPGKPVAVESDPSDLWMFNQIAIQMINEAREIIKPDGIDSEKYWDEILNRVQK